MSSFTGSTLETSFRIGMTADVFALGVEDGLSGWCDAIARLTENLARSGPVRSSSNDSAVASVFNLTFKTESELESITR